MTHKTSFNDTQGREGVTHEREKSPGRVTGKGPPEQPQLTVNSNPYRSSRRISPSH